MTTKAIINTGPHTTRQTGLPGIVLAEILPPAPGRTRAVFVVRVCPRCGGTHLHHARWPAPSLLARRAGCGHRYEVIPSRKAAG